MKGIAIVALDSVASLEAILIGLAMVGPSAGLAATKIVELGRRLYVEHWVPAMEQISKVEVAAATFAPTSRPSLPPSASRGRMVRRKVRSTA